MNRRLKRLADRAGYTGNMYAHALRATTATYWARQGMEAIDLQALMGWASIHVARKYIRLTGRRVDAAMTNCINDVDGILNTDGLDEFTRAGQFTSVTHRGIATSLTKFV